jgi:hypothetical protein
LFFDKDEQKLGINAHIELGFCDLSKKDLTEFLLQEMNNNK